MNLNKKYHISVEDESTLEKKVNLSAKVSWLILCLLGVVIVISGIGMVLLAVTPIKNYLPGYLRETERTATEEQHLRLDSLVRVYEINEAYITGILNALNPPETEGERSKAGKNLTSLTIDSLLPASDVEKEFMEKIRERDKYNISYASPAAAQTMMFGSVNKSAVITEDTKEKYRAEIILPIGSPITSIAEGKVISIASSPRASGGYEVIIQHPRGFLSKSSRLVNVMVKPGDRVSAGEIIATATATSGMKDNHIIFELWHDGDPLIPSRYLNGGRQN